MTSRHKLEPLILAGVVGITRFLFRSHDLYDVDSVNFALAIERFDPHVHQPHPPGYFLYIGLGRLLTFLVHDANLALVLLSIAGGCGAVIMIYKMALDWFGLTEARFAGILFLFSPLAWFHGTVALTYSVESFFSALLGYLCWRVDSGSVAFIAPTGIILGIAAGVRPSSLVLLGPVFLFSLRDVPWSRRLMGAAAVVLTVAAWFLPMIRASGGFNAYFGAFLSLWRLVPSKETVFNSSPGTSIARACTIIFIYLLGFGATSLALLSRVRDSSSAAPRKKLFTIVWVAPALCFFTFIFLKFVNSGYLLVLAAPACTWMGLWVSEWYASSEWRRSFKWTVIGLCAAINVVIFLESPFYCSYRSVRRFEAELGSIRTTIAQLGPVNDVMIIGFDSHFLGYRHAGYYLPDYLTIEYPEVELREGKRVFAMHVRSTSLLAELPSTSHSRFVFFPLPARGSSYEQYLQTVKDQLPTPSLHIVRLGGHDFVTGPIAEVPLLFPTVAAVSKQSVYPLLHSSRPDVNTREHQPGKGTP